mmetsp:Transcript_45588/g.87177  ORF Transcript_45588/g.87177 Transcript_45588/m.87177 type:complete len:254 (+) Transcript_45588:386-1147(+)
MQKYFVNSCLGIVGLSSFAPLIADSVCKYGPVVVECRARYRCWTFGHCLQALLILLVPEVECAVGSTGHEGALGGMEGDVIHRVDVVVFAVALEGEVLGMHGLVHVLHRHATLHRAHEIPRLVWEARDASCLVTQRRDQLLVHLVGFLEIENLDVPLSRAGHQQRVLHAQRVAFVREGLCVRWALLPQVPVPQRLVPASGDEHVEVVDPGDVADGGVVRGDLRELAGGQVPLLGLLVAAPGKHAAPVALPHAA